MYRTSSNFSDEKHTQFYYSVETDGVMLSVNFIKRRDRVLGQKALVICVDEYLTSKVCSQCDSTTVDVGDEQLRVCNRNSECPARRPAGRRMAKHRLPGSSPVCVRKRYFQSADLESGINAGINIDASYSGTSSHGIDSILDRSPCNDLSAHLLRSAVKAPLTSLLLGPRARNFS
ncbi:uncharacterized protein BYT42DRAFT_549509 [Radiomyces spectabilis]|uniref:uncharacterized protein n=1 Tax=Radiomyces spectabilis TaxID=64574 RepID=UPI002220F538|nr:uncharacterized protein BYT42DRAFT_549509 [Radiomyces spectabilis]KAI8367459.1 hypothetical protein BYT42DRAFT_549509 [Radiomyces spectabilis]